MSTHPSARNRTPEPYPARPAESRRGIQSIEVGGRLLAALSRHAAPMMLRDLAADAGMAPASAHPYLVSFVKLGMVAQDAATGRYRLGPFALELGLASLRQRDDIGLASTAAARLAAETGLSVAVAVWGNFGATIVRLEAADRPLHVSLRAGSVMSLAGTATGRVFAAWLPERIARTGLDDARSVGASPDAAETIDDAQIAAIRDRGMDRAVGSPIPGINAFSAPVFDQHGDLALVLTILGAASDLPPDFDAAPARALAACAAALSKQLGHCGPAPGATTVRAAG